MLYGRSIIDENTVGLLVSLTMEHKDSKTQRHNRYVLSCVQMVASFHSFLRPDGG